MLQYYFQYFQISMGNYCCADQDPMPSSPLKIKRKVSLADPVYKKKYERQIGQVINQALNKFKEEKKVRAIKLKSQIGRGGQGDVLLVEVSYENKFNDIFVKQYAMKRVPKTKLSLDRTRKALILENQILSTHRSDFLVNIQYAFQDDSYLYYLMEIAKGGDGFGYIYPKNQDITLKTQAMEALGEKGIKFLIGGVVLGLEYLNQIDIIYRDLKPQNILIYQDGYPKLADFGIVHRHYKQSLCYEKKGTVIYFSPQMAHHKGYDKGHDLWTLGIFLYQLLFKKFPFDPHTIQSSRFQSFLKEWEKNPIFGKRQVSEQARDLLIRLLKLNPESRLGYKSFDEIKNHKFFADFDWQKYEKKEIESPLKQIVFMYPVEFKPLSQQSNLIQQLDNEIKIPFTFVRDEQTETTSYQKIESSEESSN